MAAADLVTMMMTIVEAVEGSDEAVGEEAVVVTGHEEVASIVGTMDREVVVASEVVEATMEVLVVEAAAVVVSVIVTIVADFLIAEAEEVVMVVVVFLTVADVEVAIAVVADMEEIVGDQLEVRRSVIADVTDPGRIKK